MIVYFEARSHVKGKSIQHKDSSDEYFFIYDKLQGNNTAETVGYQLIWMFSFDMKSVEIEGEGDGEGIFSQSIKVFNSKPNEVSSGFSMVRLHIIESIIQKLDDWRYLKSK